MAISNCVINLSTDKPAVFRELARVLAPGGRVAVSDIVAEDRLTPEERAERGSYCGCIAGALSIGEYEQSLDARRVRGRRDRAHAANSATACTARSSRRRRPARAGAQGPAGHPTRDVCRLLLPSRALWPRGERELRREEPSHGPGSERAERAPIGRCDEVDPERVQVPGDERGPSGAHGFIEAPEIGPPNRASRPIVPPTAIAAASPTARVSVATAMITNIRNAVSTISQRNDCASDPDGRVAPTSAMFPSEPRRTARPRRAPGELRAPVGDARGHGKWRVSANASVTARVEVRAGDVADRVDHRHDHEPEA